MTNVQAGLLKLLIEIDELCRDNDIEYCLGGGCLMGAVRNGGFLPWDDDADIHMTRENAEKFYGIKNKLPDNRTVYTIKDYPNFLFPNVFRYVDLDSTAQATRQILLDHPTGQFIDIIILDDAPTSEEDRQVQADALGYYLELHTKNGTISSQRETEFFNKYFALEDKIKKGSGDQIMEDLRHKVYNPEYRDGEYYIVGTGIAPNPFLPRSFFEEYKRIKFEGFDLPVPINVEELLQYAYGTTWMYAPPVKEENIHTFLLDPDIPYSIIDEDQRRFISSEEYWELCCADKEAWFRTQPTRRLVNNEIRKVRGVLFRLLTKNAIERSGESPEILSKEKIQKLHDLFRSYYTFQFSETTRFWNVFEPLDDDTLYYAMLAMIECDDFAKCYKLITLRKNNVDKPLTEGMLELEERCETIQVCMNSYYVEKNYDECRTLVKEGLEKYKDDVNLLRLKVNLMYMDAEKIQDYSELNRELERVIDLYPTDGEFLFLQAEEIYRNKNYLEARRAFTNAYNQTRNGFVLGKATNRINEINEILRDYIPSIDEIGVTFTDDSERKEWHEGIKKCLELYYIDGEYEESDNLVNSLLEKYPLDINLIRLKIRILGRNARMNSDFDELNNWIEKGLKLYPNDGTILVYEGLRKTREGYYLDSVSDFRKALDCTDNIFDLDTAAVRLNAIDQMIEALKPTTEDFRRLLEDQNSNPNNKGRLSLRDSSEDNTENDAYSMNLGPSDDEWLSEDGIDEDSQASSTIEEQEWAEEDYKSDKEIEALFQDRRRIIEESIDAFYAERDIDKTRMLVEEGLAKYEDDRHLLRLKVKLDEDEKTPITGTVKHALSLYPDDGEFLLYKGYEVYLRGNIVAARRRYVEALRKTSNGFVQERVRGIIRVLNETIALYVPEIEKAGLSFDGEQEKSIQEALELYYVEKEFERCEELVQELLCRNPKDINLIRLKAKLLANKNATLSVYKELNEWVSENLELYPNDTELLVHKANSEMQAGRFFDARSIFEKVIDANENIYDMETAEKAISVIDDIIERTKADAEDCDLKSLVHDAIEALYRENDIEKCKSLIESGLTECPDEKNLSKLKLNILEINGEEQELLSEAELLSKVYPDDGFFLSHKLYNHIKNDELDEAAGLLIPALEGNSDPASEYRIGAIAEHLGVDIKTVNNLLSMEEGEPDPLGFRRNMYVSLLKEIDTICKLQRLNYYVVDDALKLMLLDHTIENNLREVSVVMLKPDFDLFREYIEKQGIANRSIEGIDNNPNMPGYYYRYVATNTLFLNLSHINAFKNFGYCITIYVPMDDDIQPNESKKIRFYDRKMRANITNVYYSEKNRKQVKNARVTRRLMGDNMYTRNINRLLCNYGLKDSNNSSYIQFLVGTKRIFPKGTFGAPQTIEYKGHKFYTVGDLEGYFESRYKSELSKEVLRPIRKIGYDFYCHTGVANKEFMDTLKKEKLFGAVFFDNRQKHLSLTKEYKVYDMPKKDCINIWRRNGERFKLWKYYIPHKEEIINMYNKGEFELLEEYLRYYIKDLLFYRKKNLGLCFDYDILMITLETIKASEKLNVTEYEIDAMYNLVPEEHLHEDIGQFIIDNAPRDYEYKIHNVEWDEL